jgi:DNA-binding IclR family transcriptional regulator
MKLSRMIYPYLRDIAMETGETTCLAINQNDQVVYINVVEAPGQMVKPMQHIGNIAPLHCTGIGKLFLSNYSPEQIDEVIYKHGLPKLTENTITTKKALLEEIAIIKKSGFALDNEECEKDIRCISLPIYDYSDKIIAGFSITGPSLRITNEYIDKWTPFLKESASKLSDSLGYRALHD